MDKGKHVMWRNCGPMLQIKTLQYGCGCCCSFRSLLDHQNSTGEQTTQHTLSTNPPWSLLFLISISFSLRWTPRKTAAHHFMMIIIWRYAIFLICLCVCGYSYGCWCGIFDTCAQQSRQLFESFINNRRETRGRTRSSITTGGRLWKDNDEFVWQHLSYSRYHRIRRPHRGIRQPIVCGYIGIYWVQALHRPDRSRDVSAKFPSYMWGERDSMHMLSLQTWSDGRYATRRFGD